MATFVRMGNWLLLVVDWPIEIIFIHWFLFSFRIALFILQMLCFRFFVFERIDDVANYESLKTEKFILFFFSPSFSQIHKRMTTEQLQSIFHVNSHGSVPPYEVIRLKHHGTHHNIVKRSINHRTSQQHLQNLSPADNNQIGGVGGSSSSKQQLHHVKKDLSKSAYYSELKRESNHNKLNTNKSEIKNVNFISANSGDSSSGNSRSSSDDEKVNAAATVVTDGTQNVHKFDENLDDVIVTDDAKDPIMQHATIDLSNINEHNVSLSAFGTVYNLTLRPTQGLFKNGIEALRMWNVRTNTNATQGLEYDEINDGVS